MDDAPARTSARHAGYPLFGDVLLERDVITEQQLDAALVQQKRTRHRLGQVLVDMGVTTKDAVLGALGIQLDLPTTSINAYTVDPAAIKAVSEKVARRHAVLPLQKVGTFVCSIGRQCGCTCTAWACGAIRSTEFAS